VLGAVGGLGANPPLVVSGSSSVMRGGGKEGSPRFGRFRIVSAAKARKAVFSAGLWGNDCPLEKAGLPWKDCCCC